MESYQWLWCVIITKLRGSCLFVPVLRLQMRLSDCKIQVFKRAGSFGSQTAPNIVSFVASYFRFMWQIWMICAFINPFAYSPSGWDPPTNASLHYIRLSPWACRQTLLSKLRLQKQMGDVVQSRLHPSIIQSMARTRCCTWLSGPSLPDLPTLLIWW